MSWFWATMEGVVFLGLTIALAVYTGRPVWVFGVFLLLTLWKFIRLVQRREG